MLILNQKVTILLPKMYLTRFSHEIERLRNKAFQPEDVVFYLEG